MIMCPLSLAAAKKKPSSGPPEYLFGQIQFGTGQFGPILGSGMVCGSQILAYGKCFDSLLLIFAEMTAPAGTLPRGISCYEGDVVNGQRHGRGDITVITSDAS